MKHCPDKVLYFYVRLSGPSEHLIQWMDSTCVLDVLIQANQLSGLCIKGDATHVVYGVKGITESVRARVPLTIEPVYLIPPIQSEVDHLVLIVKDAAGTEIARSSGQGALTFTPENTGAMYFAEAQLSGAEILVTQKLEFETISNAVKVIGGSVGEESNVRPGTEITFTVKEYTFKGEAKDIEKQEIKWKLAGNDEVLGTGTTFKREFKREGNYIVEACVNKPNAILAAFIGKGEADDWRFTVTRNYPTGIMAKGKAKAGRTIEYLANTIFPVTAEERKGLVWDVSGAAAMHIAGSEILKMPFTKPGDYNIKVSLNGKSKELKVTCQQCGISNGWWTDRDGNMLGGRDNEDSPINTIGFASWGQDSCVTVYHQGLEGEKMTLEIWDKDLIGANDLVLSKEITFPDNTTTPGFEITLDDTLKGKVKSSMADVTDAELYFVLKPVDEKLKVQNAGAAFPTFASQYLKVDSKKRAKAYFSDNNDTKRYTVASQTTPVHAQIKTTGYQDKTLITEIWESISLGLDKLLLKDLGNAKPDKYGMLSVPLKLKDILLKNASETKQLYIKVFSKEDDDEIYSSDGKYALTLHQVLKTEAVSKGTTKAMVVVDVSEESRNEKKNKKKCECEARIRAFMTMLRVGEGTTGDFGYEKVFGGKSFIKYYKKDWTTHPQIIINGGKLKSSAAGAYQIMGYSYKWLNGAELDKDNKETGKYEEYHDYIKKYNIPDFSKESQDLLCMMILRHKRNGILNLIIKNEIVKALTDYGCKEWASLPPQHYENQPAQTMEVALKGYKDFFYKELKGQSDLYLRDGFLLDFGITCKCGAINKIQYCTCGKVHIDLTGKLTFKVQSGKANCTQTCKDIVSQLGVYPEGATEVSTRNKKLMESYLQLAHENEQRDGFDYNITDFKEGIEYLDKSLEAGYPIIVGVNHTFQYRKLGIINEDTTDHYVIIVGRFCQNGFICYQFWDVGSSSGNSLDYTFKLTDTPSLVSNNTYSGKQYTVTQIRRNKKDSNIVP